METRAEKVGWKTARTQVDARRARRMSTVCGGARGRRGRAPGTQGPGPGDAGDGPGDAGDGRGDAGDGPEGPRCALGRERSWEGAEGSRQGRAWAQKDRRTPPQPEEAGKGEGPRRGVAAPGGLRASLLPLARERPEGHGRPLSPRPGKGLPALGGARVSCWVAACSPGRGGQKGQNRRTPQAAPRPGHPAKSECVAGGVFSELQEGRGGPSGSKARETKRRGRHPLTAVRCTVSCFSKPPGAAASVAPPGAGNILMALALGREPGMTLGIRAAGWRSPRCSLTGSVGRCLKRHLFLELLGLYFMKYSDCQRSCRFPFGRRQP